ncbi:hypothetical protein LJB94_00110 [Odoribacter sp. OttesenSCG-928-G04]|nr:hypothetical protein [Odoribacter sp. OttesenSCG-928-G04]MDL2331017.1 hypothetical protein [Odoribacter sp. OttesenSCG-928-A06]
MKKNLLLMMFAALFIGCSSSDSDDDNNDNNNGNTPGSKKRVSEINIVYSDPEDDYSYNFFYDKNGAVEKIIETGTDGPELTTDTYTFKRSGNTLNVSFEWKGEYTSTKKTSTIQADFTCPLNKDGYATEVKYEYTDEDGYLCEFHDGISYTNGYVTKMYAESWYDGDEDGGNGEYEFIWKDGNLTKTGFDESESMIYSTIENKSGIDLFLSFNGLCLHWAGYMGKSNKNLIESWTENDWREGGTYYFEYEFDKDGYVIVQHAYEKRNGQKELDHSTYFKYE